MPGIWTFIFIFGLYAVVARQMQVISNRFAGREDDDMLGQPGCLSPILVIFGFIYLIVGILYLFSWV